VMRLDKNRRLSRGGMIGDCIISAFSDDLDGREWLEWTTSGREASRRSPDVTGLSKLRGIDCVGLSSRLDRERRGHPWSGIGLLERA
jgi:hypothetical protein